MLRFLRLFGRFREMEALVAMQARNIEECDGTYKALLAEKDRLAAGLAELRSEIDEVCTANDQLATDKTLLGDRLESAIQDKDRLWETMNQALNGERYAYQTMVNHAVQKTGGGIPYVDAHSLPPSEIRQLQKPGPIGRSSRMLPSEGALRATNSFVREFVETLGPPEKVA